MNYEIGSEYYYPNDPKKQKFKLIETKGFIFKFDCGHWYINNVFIDLINAKTNIQVYKDTQLRLFNYITHDQEKISRT